MGVASGPRARRDIRCLLRIEAAQPANVTRILADLRLSNGRGAASGAEVEYRYGTVFTVRGGKIVVVREYASLPKALDAVGLRE